MPEEKFDTPEFLARLRAGDDSAWKEIVCGMEKLVISKILSIVPDRNIAEELRQEVFIKAFRAIENFRGDCQIRSWLVPIAKNEALTYLRKKRGLEVAIDPDEIDPKRPMDEQLEDKEIVEKILTPLSREEHQLLLLRYSEGLTVQEIADRLGSNEKTVGSRLSRLLKKLRLSHRNELESTHSVAFQ
jgi:RNA polymerase sigma-70 factor, ECF subfamily